MKIWSHKHITSVQNKSTQVSNIVSRKKKLIRKTILFIKKFSSHLPLFFHVNRKMDEERDFTASLSLNRTLDHILKMSLEHLPNSFTGRKIRMMCRETRCNVHYSLSTFSDSNCFTHVGCTMSFGLLFTNNTHILLKTT